jgi:hypothetical protein
LTLDDLELHALNLVVEERVERHVGRSDMSRRYGDERCRRRDGDWSVRASCVDDGLVVEMATAHDDASNRGGSELVAYRLHNFYAVYITLHFHNHTHFDV